jgi:hypothetical protein
MKSVWMCAAAVVGLLGRNAVAQSYNDIPEIEVYGQHFFYTNNGTQLYVHTYSIYYRLL